MLEGLRKRISSLFLSFIETPEFNPVSAQHQVVPMVGAGHVELFLCDVPVICACACACFACVSCHIISVAIVGRLCALNINGRLCAP